MPLRELLTRLRDRLRRDQLSAELDEELRYHRALLANDPRYAHQAQRTIGNVTYYKEETRAMWSLGIFDDILHDVRYAARVLRRDFGFTAAVVITLALGIGANTAVFSIVNAVLLRDLPYADPDRLVSVSLSPSGSPTNRDPTSLPDIRDWQQQSSTVFSGLAGYASNRWDVSGPEGDTQLRAVQATGNLYDVLGTRPLLGRVPRGDEENAPVVTISYRVWQSRYAGSRDIIGKSIRLGGQPYTIVGVMPRGFQFPNATYDLWGTLSSISTAPTRNGVNVWLTSRSLRGYRVVARLKPGVTMTHAERAMTTIERGLAKTFPEDDGTEVHLQTVRSDTVGKVQRALWTVFGAAGLILLLACVNVAHLLLARLSSRERELAVRRALGAHRGRVMRQLITESVLLGLIGGAAGVAVAFVAKRALLHFAPSDMPRLETVAIDAQTLTFALGLSVVTGLLFGVAPALLGWGNTVHDTLRAQGKGAGGGVHGGRTRSLLTALEVSFAVVLLVGAGLMLRSFAHLTSTDLGVRPEGVTVAQVTAIGPKYQSDESKTRAIESILVNLRATPGVTAAGASTSMPPTRLQESEPFEISGKPAMQPGRERVAIYIPATSGYLEALGIPVLSGRTFDTRDNATSAPTAIVTKELVRRYFEPTENPIGREISLSGVTRTIVGVAGDAVYEGVGAPMSPVVYLPFAQSPFPGVWIAIRSTRSATALTSAVRDAIHKADAELPAHQPESLESMIGESVVRPRFNAWLLSTFGGLALLLASIGIYSVIAYGVTQRRPEIGIRLALGAPTRSVVTMVLRSGMVPVMIGIAGGTIVARIGSKLVAGLLYGIPATDVVTFAGVALVLGLSAFVAAYIPARRAARVDPLAAIRAE